MKEKSVIDKTLRFLVHNSNMVTAVCITVSSMARI